MDVFNGQIFHEEMFKLRTKTTPSAGLNNNNNNNNKGDKKNENKNDNNKKVTNEKLPVDEFRDQILQKVNNERVIIIHGETGCGNFCCCYYCCCCCC